MREPQEFLLCEMNSSASPVYNQLGNILRGYGSVTHVQELPKNSVALESIPVVFSRLSKGLPSSARAILEDYVSVGGRLILLLEAGMEDRYLSSVNSMLENYGISVCSGNARFHGLG